MKFAIDLLWVKPQKSGGVESYIRNLLDGILEIRSNFQVVLLVSLDNKFSFFKYKRDKRFILAECDVESKNPLKRIIWQNLHLTSLLNKLGIKICFEPVYSKPIFNRKIKFITTIHDLQAIHYPEYQSKLKVLWLRFSWWNTVRTSKHIVAISDYVKRDIIDQYHIKEEKISRIYNPICLKKEEILDRKNFIKKYGGEEYFYTVSSLLPHKNLETLIKLIKLIKDKKINLPKRLIISGIKGEKEEKILELIEKEDLKENIELTGFIPNKERNSLYKYCKLFLFPSVFEGFGMPLVEANFYECKIVTTRCGSIEEITEGKLLYVDKPYDANEWVEKIKIALKKTFVSIDYIKYSPKIIALEYMNKMKNLE